MPNFQYSTSIKTIFLFYSLNLLLSNCYIALEISPFRNCHLISNIYFYISSNYSYHRKDCGVCGKSVVPFYRRSGGVSQSADLWKKRAPCSWIILISYFMSRSTSVLAICFQASVSLTTEANTALPQVLTITACSTAQVPEIHIKSAHAARLLSEC